MEMDKTMYGSRELEFAIFCIENVASKLNVDAAKVYAALTEQTDILNEYIIPEYEVLHTQSKEYIVNDIIDIMKDTLSGDFKEKISQYQKLIDDFLDSYEIPENIVLSRRMGGSQVENLVNQWIKDSIPVTHYEVSKEEAVKLGAEAQFIERYGDRVTVYQIGDVSLEICGGPHVSNTSELGHFKIKKEESSSAGVRRIKAVLTSE